MVINSESNFTNMVMRLLNGLNYENVQEHNDKTAIDITAVKDGEKCCFRCQYAIDAISEKQMTGLIESGKAGRYDKIVFVTNSSFSVAAKRAGDEAGVVLWDRNTFDRMAISISEKLDDEVKEETKKTGLYIGIGVAALVVIIGVAAVLYFMK